MCILELAKIVLTDLAFLLVFLSCLLVYVATSVVCVLAIVAIDNYGGLYFSGVQANVDGEVFGVFISKLVGILASL